VSLEGRMIDRPHLLQAQRILAMAQRGRRGS
jgi:citrate lyase beta subunit